MERIVKVILAAEVNNYLANYERARQANVKLKESGDDAFAAYERQSRAMEYVGARLTAVGAVATAVTALSVKAAIDWESAWAGVTKTVDGTDEQMAQLEEQLRSLTSVLPATHEEIAGVAEAAGQLGVARDDVASFTRTMIDLSETTNLSADEAATSIAQLMNIMQTAPENVRRLGSTLVALGNDGASTERDIVQMAQRIAGAGKLVGATEGEVLGLANALASMGVTAELGGGVASRILQDLYSAVKSGGDSLKGFAQIAGQTSQEFAAAFENDPVRALDSFAKGLNGVEASGGNVVQTLSDLGFKSTEEQRVLLQLKGAGDLLTDSLDLQAKAWNENNALTAEASKRYETTEAKIQIASNAVRDASIDFGSAFLPTIKAVAEAVTDLAKGFSDIPEGTQQQIAFLAALAGGATLLAGAYLLAIPKIAEFNAALTTLRASELPGVARAAEVTASGIGKVRGALSATASFLSGPWGIALSAAVVGVGVLQKVLDGLRASSAEMQNSLATAKDGMDILETAAKGRDIAFFRDVSADLENLKELLPQTEERFNNFWLNAQDIGKTSSPIAAVRSTLDDVGKQLATLSDTDAPAAARAFKLIADETNLSDSEMQLLLKRMPEYQDALLQQAQAQGVAIDTTEDNRKVQQLLNFALKEAEPVTKTAAEAYQDAAEESKALTDEILSLIDAINEANGTGQDAVTTNARYQEALAGISEEVQRQKDAYEEANGSLDGFNLSLHENTASGSANAAMLADVARAAQDAAKAQFEQDQTTMSAKDAADKYNGTLAAQRQAFIDSAIQAGFNADQVQILADKVFALPTEREVQVLVDSAQAQQNVDAFLQKIGFIPAKKIVTIETIQKYGPISPEYYTQLGGRAGGGIIPGAPSEKDNVVYALATGEFVTRARVVAEPRNRAWLEHMNAGGKMPPLRGYADGGFVQPRYLDMSPQYAPRQYAAGESADVAALRAEFQMMRSDLREIARRPIQLSVGREVVADAVSDEQRWSSR